MLTGAEHKKTSNALPGYALYYRSLAELNDPQVRFCDVGCEFDSIIRRYTNKGHGRDRVLSESSRLDEADFSRSKRLLFGLRFPWSTIGLDSPISIEEGTASMTLQDDHISSVRPDNASHLPGAGSAASSSKRIGWIHDEAGSYDRISAGPITDGNMRQFVRSELQGKFERRFVEIQVQKYCPGAREFDRQCEKGLEYLHGTTGSTQLADFLRRKVLTLQEQLEVFGVEVVKLRRYNSADLQEGSRGNEDTGSVRLCMLMNGIRRAMIGDSYKNQYHWVGKSKSQPCEDDDDSRGEDNGDKPDIIVLKMGRATIYNSDTKQAEYNFEELVSAGEGKLQLSSDMNTEEVILQMMKYTSRLVRAHPISGPVMTFTWCGYRLRYWVTTPDCFSSSQLMDLSRTVNDMDFVRMIAFLGGREQALPQWQPGPTVNISYPGRNKPTQNLEWRRDPDDFVHNRYDLTRSRTYVHAGQIGPDKLPVVGKAAWLDPQLSEQEYKILCILEGDQASTVFPDAKGPLEAQTLDVLQRLPYFDKVKNRMTRPFGNSIIESSGSHRWLYMPLQHEDMVGGRRPKVLSILYTHGVPDSLVKDVPDLNPRQLVGILTDLICELHYAACHGVHYRDLNTGNIVLRKTAEGQAGCFIDYGNAVYAGERRRIGGHPLTHKKACEEDGRSANNLFICLDSLTAQELAEAVDRCSKYLEEAKTLSGKETAKANLEIAERKLNAHHLHRYTSDLESLLYWFCYEFGRRAKYNDPALQLQEKLYKTDVWNGNLEALMNKIQPARTVIVEFQLISEMVTSLARLVKQTRTDLTKMDANDLTLRMTAIENDCFRKCVEVATQTKDKLQEDAKPVKRSA